MPMPTSIEQRPRLRTAEGIAIVGFLAANVIIPLVWGDVFPFTTAPMFRDTPQAYCIYHVFTTDGRELPAADFLLQRIYDGNPPGYGVGIQPPATLAEFGRVATAAEIEEHVRRHWKMHQDLETIEIEQQVIGPQNNGSVGLVASQRIKVTQPSATP